MANAPLFVLTGAGCSTESGIPDYRDAQGDWKYNKPTQFLDFMHNGSARKRYWARSMNGWYRVSAAQSNLAHKAISELQEMGFIQSLVTQNVDGLHKMAGSNALELHGNLHKVICMHCGALTEREQFQQQLLVENPGFATNGLPSAPDGDALIEDLDFHSFIVPDCDRCGGILKPDVIFFGENVPSERVKTALEALGKARGVLVVGSSLMVYSGYRYLKAAHQQNKAMAAVNVGVTRADNLLDLKISQRCGTVLSGLINDGFLR